MQELVLHVIDNDASSSTIGCARLQLSILPFAQLTSHSASLPEHLNCS